jgi:RNA-directed DNA polymerase
MMTTVTTDKPFRIEKRRVYEAYKAVRSNRGAAGVMGKRSSNSTKIWG